ncbi:hypothetical protein ACULNC_09520 [Shigella flexneri]
MPECVAAPKVRSSGSIKPAPSITLNYPRQSFDTRISRGRKAAIAQLRQFCENGAGEVLTRDFPAVEGTSRCPPAWQRAGYRLASVCIACWRNSRRRWTVGPEVWLSELIGASSTVI